MDSFEFYKKAGKIASQVKEYSRQFVKEDAKYIELAEKIESKIKELGGEIAFPVNISVNEIAAHDTAYHNDTRLLKKGDVVKIDIGVHIDGYIADTAYTAEVKSNEFAKLILASKESLEKSQKLIKKAATYGAFGESIENTIKDKGFLPIKNLGGHRLQQYELHSEEEIIPNYANNSKTEFFEGEAIAIEPFATNGAGFVIDTRLGPIYSFMQKRPIRVMKAREVLGYIEKNYKLLPFSKRWLVQKFGNVDFILDYLCKEGILHNYAVLKDKLGGIVSQAENTGIVQKEGIFITTE